MKTSNILLITLAALLFTIPLIFIVVNLRTNYQDVKTFQMEMKKVRTFDSDFPGQASLPNAKSFTELFIKNGKDVTFIIKFTKDKNTGIKIDEKALKYVTTSMGENGAFVIEAKDLSKKTRILALHVYAPSISVITAMNLEGLEVSASLDSLSIHSYGVRNIRLDNDTRIKNLFLTARSGQTNIGSESIEKLKLNLVGNNIEIDRLSPSASEITIEAEHSSISINGAEYKSPKKIISLDKLVLNSKGKGNISLKNVTANSFLGNFSDSTMVKMPGTLLKKMKSN